MEKELFPLSVVRFGAYHFSLKGRFPETVCDRKLQAAILDFVERNKLLTFGQAEGWMTFIPEDVYAETEAAYEACTWPAAAKRKPR